MKRQERQSEYAKADHSWCGSIRWRDLSPSLTGPRDRCRVRRFAMHEPTARTDVRACHARRHKCASERMPSNRLVRGARAVCGKATAEYFARTGTFGLTARAPDLHLVDLRLVSRRTTAGSETMFRNASHLPRSTEGSNPCQGADAPTAAGRVS